MLKLIYPEAEKWMWNYCIYLGPYIDKRSNKLYDLGVYVNPGGDLSAAIVYGNKSGQYLSGEEKYHKNESVVYKETFKRAHIVGL